MDLLRRLGTEARSRTNRATQLTLKTKFGTVEKNTRANLCGKKSFNCYAKVALLMGNYVLRLLTRVQVSSGRFADNPVPVQGLPLINYNILQTALQQDTSEFNNFNILNRLC